MSGMEIIAEYNFTFSPDQCIYIGYVNSSGTWGDYNGTNDEKSWGRLFVQLGRYTPDASLFEVGTNTAVTTSNWTTATNKDKILKNLTDNVRYGMATSGTTGVQATREGTNLSGGSISNLSSGATGAEMGLGLMQQSGTTNNNNAIWAYGGPIKNGTKRRWGNGSQPFNFKQKRWIIGDDAGNTPPITFNMILVRWEGLTQTTYRPFTINGAPYFCNPNDVLGDNLPVISYTQIPSS